MCDGGRGREETSIGESVSICPSEKDVFHCWKLRSIRKHQMSDTAAACHHSFQGKLCLETKGEKTNDPIFFLMNTSPTSDPAKASGGGEMPGKGTGRLVCMTSALLFCFVFHFFPLLLSSVLSSHLFFKFQQHWTPTLASSGQTTATCRTPRNRWKQLQQRPHVHPGVPAASGTAAGPPLRPWPYRAHRSQSKHIALNLKKKKKILTATKTVALGFNFLEMILSFSPWTLSNRKVDKRHDELHPCLSLVTIRTLHASHVHFAEPFQVSFPHSATAPLNLSTRSSQESGHSLPCPRDYHASHDYH